MSDSELVYGVLLCKIEWYTKPSDGLLLLYYTINIFFYVFGAEIGTETQKILRKTTQLQRSLFGCLCSKTKWAPELAFYNCRYTERKRKMNSVASGIPVYVQYFVFVDVLTDQTPPQPTSY